MKNETSISSSSFETLLSKAMQIMEIDTLAHLADTLSVTQSSISGWKSREAIGTFLQKLIESGYSWVIPHLFNQGEVAVSSRKEELELIKSASSDFYVDLSILIQKIRSHLTGGLINNESELIFLFLVVKKSEKSSSWSELLKCAEGYKLIHANSLDKLILPPNKRHVVTFIREYLSDYECRFMTLHKELFQSVIASMTSFHQDMK